MIEERIGSRIRESALRMSELTDAPAHEVRVKARVRRARQRRGVVAGVAGLAVCGGVGLAVTHDWQAEPTPPSLATGDSAGDSAPTDVGEVPVPVALGTEFTSTEVAPGVSAISLPPFGSPVLVTDDSGTLAGYEFTAAPAAFPSLADRPGAVSVVWTVDDEDAILALHCRVLESAWWRGKCAPTLVAPPTGDGVKQYTLAEDVESWIAVRQIGQWTAVAENGDPAARSTS